MTPVLFMLSMIIVITFGLLANRAPAALRRYGKHAERALIIGIGLLIVVSLLVSLVTALQSTPK